MILFYITRTINKLLLYFIYFSSKIKRKTPMTVETFNIKQYDKPILC